VKKMVEIRKAEANIGLENVKIPSKRAEEVGPDKDKCNRLIFNPFLEGMKEEVKEMHST
jgi:16S rRNA G527 N7-methylase RsmG